MRMGQADLPPGGRRGENAPLPLVAAGAAGWRWQDARDHRGHLGTGGSSREAGRGCASTAQQLPLQTPNKKEAEVSHPLPISRVGM